MKNDAELASFAERAAEDVGHPVTTDDLRQAERSWNQGHLRMTQSSHGWNLRIIFERMTYLAEVLLKMTWKIWTAPPTRPLITSDSPVVFLARDAASAATRPDHVYLPLSPRFLLALSPEPQSPHARLTIADTVRVNKLQVSHCDEEVFASFRSRELQEVVDEIVGMRPPRDQRFAPA